MAASRLSTTATRGSTAASSSQGHSRRATVELSEDDEELDYVGGTLDRDGDITMELVESEDEQSEDDESELSKSTFINTLAFFDTFHQSALPRTGQHQSMPSSGPFLTSSMLQAVVATFSCALPRAANRSRGRSRDFLIKAMRSLLVTCGDMQRTAGVQRSLHLQIKQKTRARYERQQSKGYWTRSR
jgi:hypothetical protein